MTHTPALSSFAPIDEQSIPTSTDRLLELFESSPQHLLRMCAIARIKSQIIASLSELNHTPPSAQTCQAVELLFELAVTRFLRRWRGQSQQEEREGRLFSHVAGLAIKYYFREEAFKELINKITELLDGHSERIAPALNIFQEIVGVIEYSEREARSPRCQFERYFVGQHLNAMLVMANFCIEKGLIRSGHISEDIVAEEVFLMKAPETAMLAAFRLLHTILCFDWVGEKYNDFEEVSDWSSIVIPTKATKQSGVTEFQKWLKNCEWVRLYELLIVKCKSVELKLQVIELIGDMSRIHMKYFKNKNNFKNHIENIVYSFCQIMGEMELSRNSQETIRVAIALGRNLNKLVTTGVGAILFEINVNFFRGILDSIRKFIIQQVIGQEIFNSNLILYLFKFLDSLVFKSKFEKTTAKFEEIEEKVREICRNYEHYIRQLFNRIIKTTERKSEPVHYRMDCAGLKESIRTYDTKELQIYFLPFRMMKPRYASTSTIQELFVYVTARIMRALGLLQYFRLSEWQKDLAFEIIAQSTEKIFEWFSYTSFRRNYEVRQRQSSGIKQMSELPTISETYEEEIQNEQQYCHFLRLICFLVMEQFVQQKPFFYSNISGTLLKMIGLVLQLTYGADLQEEDSRQMKDESTRLRLESALQVCEQLCLKVLLKQLESKLHSLTSNDRKKYIDYQFVYYVGEFNIYQSSYPTQKVNLIELIAQYCSSHSNLSRKSLVKLQFLLCLCTEDELGFNLNLNLQQYCVIMESLVANPILVALVKANFRKIIHFLENTLLFLQQHSHQIAELGYYLTCLRIIGALQLQNISEEALNKLFVSLKYCLPLLSQSDVMTEQLSQELTLITEELLLPSKQIDMCQLGEEVRKIVIQNKRKMQKGDMDTTRMSMSFPQLPQFEDSSKSKDRNIDLSLSSQKQDERQIFSENQPQRSSQRKQEQNSNQKIIYSGYHRDRTMQLINRYVEDEPLPVISSQSQEMDLEQPRKPELQQRVDQYAQNQQKDLLIPMEIEQPTYQQKDEDLQQCLQSIRKAAKQYEHTIQHLESTDEHKHKLSLPQDSCQDLIPYTNEDDVETEIEPVGDPKETHSQKVQHDNQTENNSVGIDREQPQAGGVDETA